MEVDFLATSGARWTPSSKSSHENVWYLPPVTLEDTFYMHQSTCPLISLCVPRSACIVSLSMSVVWIPWILREKSACSLKAPNKWILTLVLHTSRIFTYMCGPASRLRALPIVATHLDGAFNIVLLSTHRQSAQVQLRYYQHHHPHELLASTTQRSWARASELGASVAAGTAAVALGTGWLFGVLGYNTLPDPDAALGGAGESWEMARQGL